MAHILCEHHAKYGIFNCKFIYHLILRVWVCVWFLNFFENWISFAICIYFLLSSFVLVFFPFSVGMFTHLHLHFWEIFRIYFHVHVQLFIHYTHKFVNFLHYEIDEIFLMAKSHFVSSSPSEYIMCVFVDFHSFWITIMIWVHLKKIVFHLRELKQHFHHTTFPISYLFYFPTRMNVQNEYTY